MARALPTQEEKRNDERPGQRAHRSARLASELVEHARRRRVRSRWWTAYLFAPITDPLAPLHRDPVSLARSVLDPRWPGRRRGARFPPPAEEQIVSALSVCDEVDLPVPDPIGAACLFVDLAPVSRPVSHVSHRSGSSCCLPGHDPNADQPRRRHTWRDGEQPWMPLWPRTRGIREPTPLLIPPWKEALFRIHPQRRPLHDHSDGSR